LVEQHARLRTKSRHGVPSAHICRVSISRKNPAERFLSSEIVPASPYGYA
jgi:hypothetical protein